MSSHSMGLMGTNTVKDEVFRILNVHIMDTHGKGVQGELVTPQLPKALHVEDAFQTS